jgi:hypothetical protein
MLVGPRQPQNYGFLQVSPEASTEFVCLNYGNAARAEKVLSVYGKASENLDCRGVLQCVSQFPL